MFRSAIQAEAAFYEAFRKQDVGSMMKVWAEGRPIFCIHPGGGPLTSRGIVEESWKQIFQGKVPYTIVLDYYHREEFDQQFAVSQLSETLYLRDHFVGTVWATNIYCWTDEGWRMMLHHASESSLGSDLPEPEQPALH